MNLATILLAEVQNEAPKTVFFCQSFKYCYQLYEYLKSKLKVNFTYPPDLRLVEMYHVGCLMYVRENVLKYYLETPGLL